MAKRDNGSRTRTTSAAPATEAAAGDVMEQRIVAFAEQLGRIAGTVQAKTEGWMDRDALRNQIAGVRDSAADLLQQLTSSVSEATTGKNAASAKKPASSSASTSKGRSGGVVDAPGKKHRRPAPKDPRAAGAAAKVSSMRATKASMKTMKQRGRG